MDSETMVSDSFFVDMERFSHLTDKDIATNSRINLQRSLSRKGSQRGGEKKINLGTGTEIDTSFVATSSPRAGALAGGSTTEKKPLVLKVGATDKPMNSQVQHQITIVTGNIGGCGLATAESKWGGSKRSSFKRSPLSWNIDPRQIVLFFATLSSMGTILLIYLTLSVGKLSRDDNGLDW